MTFPDPRYARVMNPTAHEDIKYTLTVTAGVPEEIASSLLHNADNETLREMAAHMRGLTVPAGVTNLTEFWISIVDPDIPAALPPQT